MKYSAIYLLIAAFTIGSCKKDTAAKTTSSHFVLATVSGSGGSFSASDDMVKTNKNSASPLPYVEVNGTSPSGARITVWIYSYAGTIGTFSMDGSNYGGMYKPTSTAAVIPSAHGSLIVTAVTPNLTGSFNFTCTDSTVIAGTFNSATP
jgi:hypothetical protein